MVVFQICVSQIQLGITHYEEEYVSEPDAGYFQEAMVVNYPSADVPFTRIVEYKHTPNQPEAARTGEVKGTLIAKAGGGAS